MPWNAIDFMFFFLYKFQYLSKNDSQRWFIKKKTYNANNLFIIVFKIIFEPEA